MSDTLWKEIIDYTEKNKITANDFKKLNIVFENKLMSQASHIRERMAGNVSDFVFHLMTEVFNAKDSAPFAINLILEKESFDPGPKAEQIEKAEHWTQALIREKAKTLSPNKGPTGDFDD